MYLYATHIGVQIVRARVMQKSKWPYNVQSTCVRGSKNTQNQLQNTHFNANRNFQFLLQLEKCTNELKGEKYNSSTTKKRMKSGNVGLEMNSNMKWIACKITQ